VSDQIQSVDDRSIAAAVGAGRRWYQRFRKAGLWAGIMMSLLLLVWLLVPGGPKEKIEPYRDQPRATHSEYVPPPPVEQPAVVATPRQPPPQPVPAIVEPAPQLNLGNVVKAKPPDRPAIISFNTSAVPDYMKKMAGGGVDAVQNTQADPGGIQFKPASFEGTRSFTIAHRDYMLMRWSTIICVMDTEIITGAGGAAPFRCHVKNAVLSPTGVTLLEAGTIVGGTYTSLVGEGQNRIVAVSAEAQSPNGVIADIGGPIADQLGAAGVAGSVDEHWWQRIGGAMLLSLIDNGFGLAQAALSKGGNTYLNFDTGGGVGTISQQLLSKTINIPPTITLNQGTEIALWVTKYVDFSPSYRLEPTRGIGP
jgi:type IV secretion system protein VirB10